MVDHNLLAIHQYKTIVFDCDGVVLDSNVIKTEAYFRTAKNLGASDAQAQALVDYHVKLGGISRYHKFDWFLTEILQQPATSAAIQTWLDMFATELETGLMQCAIADGIESLRAHTTGANWMILSGGDQAEIRHLFARRVLASGTVLETLFDGGLFGSPDNKDTVLAREIASGNIQFPALFIGDSKYDYEAAHRAGLDFVFVSDWTEVADWKSFCELNQLVVKPNLSKLLAC